MQLMFPALAGFTLAAFILCAATVVSGTVGFERVTVPDSDDKPRQIGIWYPSDTPASPQPLGPYRQTVANDGTITGSQLPLVVILHGVQGMFENHYHTALALAEAGFVVAGVSQGQDMRLAERPRHVGSVLNYMLAAWRHHDRLDPSGIGIFGFSVGGFTALVAVGGMPDLSRMASYCAEHPDRVCGMSLDTSVSASAWVHDARLKAAVVAAPTLGFTFSPDVRTSIKVPIQLWRAGNDEITPHPGHAEAIYNALLTKPDYVVVPNAGHFVFLACTAEIATRAPAICQDAPHFDRDAFHQMFNSRVVAFFKTHLRSP